MGFQNLIVSNKIHYFLISPEKTVAVLFNRKRKFPCPLLLLGGAQPPLEFFFQEQSYSSHHSGPSLAWDHVRGDIDDSSRAIADFCGVVADPGGAFAIGGRAGADAATAFVARLAKHHKTLLNIVKHHETHVQHCETL